MSIGSQIEPPLPPAGPEERQGSSKLLKWHQRVLGFCFAIFALEVGLFLLIFPWLSSWDLNWVPRQTSFLRTLWMSPYLRGALSGLGLVNLYVGFAELARQLKSLFN
jgi:hypothetical protein